MMQIVTPAYCTSAGGAIGSAAAAATTVQLAAAIAAASRMVESICQRSFYPRRRPAEGYDAISRHSLSLKHGPLVQLNSVTLFPDGPSPSVFQASAFDLDFGQARLTFKYGQNGTFYQRLYGAGPFGGRRADIVSVDYFSGYGGLTTLAAPVLAGASSIDLAATRGRSPGQDGWSIAAGSQLVLDSGLATEESAFTQAGYAGGNPVSVSSPLDSHSSGAYVSVVSAPADVEYATALIAGNILNVGDLSKQQEMLGRLGGYVYTQRTGNALVTPEVLAILSPYREIVI